MDQFLCQVIRSSSALSSIIDRVDSVNFTVDTVRADAWARVWPPPTPLPVSRRKALLDVLQAAVALRGNTDLYGMGVAADVASDADAIFLQVASAWPKYAPGWLAVFVKGAMTEGAELPHTLPWNDRVEFTLVPAFRRSPLLGDTEAVTYHADNDEWYLADGLRDGLPLPLTSAEVSNALRCVDGLHPTMLLYRKVTRDPVRAEPPPPAQVRPPATVPPTGLPNGCNFCFANVTLQVLYAILPLRRAVLEGHIAPDLAPTFQSMESGDIGLSADRDVMAGVFGDWIKGWRQEEWATAFTGFIERHCPANFADTAFQHFFTYAESAQGIVQVSVRLDPRPRDFLDILNRDDVQAFTVPSVVVFDIQRTWVLQDPEHLAADGRPTEIPMKDRRRLPFPLTADLRTPLLGDVGTPNQEVHVLAAVIVHLGQTPNGGHYTVYVRKAGQWWYCNDQHVTPKGQGWVPNDDRIERDVVGLVYVADPGDRARSPYWDL
jgi:hypothetical protein